MKQDTITLTDTSKALDEIRQCKDLREFQNKQSDAFCKKYKIKSGQFNFLLSVIAVERDMQNKNK